MKRYLGILLVVALAVLLLAAASPASAVVYAPENCVNCHAAATPGIVLQFQQGAMSKSGVTCVDCHGGDHDAILQADGKVPASRCQVCHPQQYAEFTTKDGQGNLEKHAQGWTRMLAGARYKVMPADERYAMCERCHNIGYVWSDGSIGKCDSCHTRHTFSAEEAKEPPACGTCHMGPDHEQIDMWEKSKHGVVYTTERERPDGDPNRAPGCVTCHMPTLENGAGQPLTHNVSTNITIGTVAQGAQVGDATLKTSVPMRAISQSDFDSRRGKMLRVCGVCHAPGYAATQLANADQVKLDVDARLWDPVMRIRGLWYDGLLDPMPANRPPNPAYPTVDNGMVLVLGGQQLYTGTSAIEQMFFQTYKYDHVNTFKGAYHINPDYSHWFGWARVLPNVDTIRSEEARLRKAAVPYDPGFTVTPSKPTVGGTTTFNASGLVAWGDGSPNTFTWQFGEAYVAGGTTGDVVTYKYAAPGRFPAQLTVSDTDLVNDAANPTSCSALRTTTVRVTVKHGAQANIPTVPRVAKGKSTTVTVKLYSTGSGTGTIELQRKSGSSSWAVCATKANAQAVAGTWKSYGFSVKLDKQYSFRAIWKGTATIWSATSKVRTVKPL